MISRHLLAIAAFCLVSSLHANADDTIDFNQHVRPILSANCFACHGFDAKSRQADLRLDIADGAYAERNGTVAVKPHDLAASLIWERINSSDPEQVMPPTSFHAALSDADKEVIRKWIEQGAAYQKHWAFEPPVAGEVPAVQNEAWVKNDIDRFILAKLEEKGLTPQPEADRPTLIRRVSFALTGLPPAPAEVRRFLDDQSADAYEKMVERYLSSPQYGEEMARHWLDLARYADTHGLHLDNEREMWAYRDWVIEAFNSKMPFDQFTIEQLAGDLLPNPTKEQLIATGFNRCNVTTAEGGSIDEELLFRYAVDRASTTVENWMGLTAGCAVCHDHKFDPISAKEFYSLYAFFYSNSDPAMDGNIRNTHPFLSLSTPEQDQKIEELRAAHQAAIDKHRAFTATMEYLDPHTSTVGTESAIPEAVEVTEVLLDDLLPLHTSARTKKRDPLTWTHASQIPSASGLRSLSQFAGENYYDHFENFGVPIVMPENGKISVWVRPDADAPPKSIMIEFATSEGIRAAIWGNPQLLGSGEVGSPQRFHAGPIPTPGEWTQLEVTAEQLKWNAGVAIDRFSLMQVEGAILWDLITFSGVRQPHVDPRASFHAWWSQRKDKATPGIPGELTEILKAGPEQEVTAEQREALLRYFLTHIARPITTELAEHQLQLSQAEAALKTLQDQIPGTFIYKELDTPRQSHVMTRGQYNQPGDAVSPSTPAVLPALQVDGLANRLDLAKWLMADSHPLTARVAVNRHWQQFFGIGLVETASDFGAQGAPPSHPELLDWLAVWYRTNKWKTDGLVRLIVNSATFRQQSAVNSQMLEVDPKNRLLGRGARLRLDAEQIRDNALLVSGLINLQLGGPGVKFYQPANIWEPVGYEDSNTRFYFQDHGDKLYRRSVYAFLKRTAPPPFLSNFDAPNREQACPRRERSNTPLQALQLLNDIQHVEAARSMASRILREGGPAPQERLSFAWKLVLVRDIEVSELQILEQELQGNIERFSNDEEAAQKLIAVGESPVPQDLDPKELAAYTLISNLILNLDETVNRN
ncbi:DUF1553 domain-containing protein [Planctomicrobium sp. SH668]|uniref:DUF1553 domain-containing protein n=1 Tax=Planctomicrobium sp. SH668 TaxID=3448126 RepID=UPI003F5B826F